MSGRAVDPYKFVYDGLDYVSVEDTYKPYAIFLILSSFIILSPPWFLSYLTGDSTAWVEFGLTSF